MAPTIDELDEPLSTADKRLGTIVAGTYRITRHIGSGGSSHVFEAEHVRLGSPFALKLLRPELDSGRRAAQRFRREARAVARLKNEHIVNVVDCGELEDGTPYLAMELLEGEDLRTLLRQSGVLPVRRATQLVLEACQALTAVHAAGLVHRDLKPENLFVTRRAKGEDWCKVLDFGVAKMEASLSTAPGAIVGTVRYMAPEQLSASHEVGPATDVYALGAILYECLAGTPLCDAATVQEVMYQVMNREPVSLAELRPELPAALVDVVSRATAKRVEQRPQSANELYGLLVATLTPADASSSSDTTWTEADAVVANSPRRAPTPRRGFGSLLLLAPALAGIVIGWTAHRTDSSPAQAAASAPSSAKVVATVNAPEPASPAISPPPPEPQAPGAAATTATSAEAAAGPAPKRPTSAPRVTPDVPKSAEAQNVRVGGFDPANPYGD